MLHFDVMSHLYNIDDWSSFKQQLITLKGNGVRAITTPIWWGMVEHNEGRYDWSYYKEYAETVKEAGLKWVPIFATHKCGSSVGDNVHISLPKWLFKKALPEEMLFKDEDGAYCDEVLSLWWPDTVKLYGKLYSSFCKNFKEYWDVIVQINLSMGPASELKYPSYNPDCGWKYPGRGKLQAYSEAAINSFRHFLKNKYCTVKKLNNAWSIKLKSFKDIHPPKDRDNFFINGIHSTYGHDFMDWYQGSLEQHFTKVVQAANIFRQTFPSAEICQTLAGIHWLKYHHTMPNAAEYCAGYYDYERLIKVYKKINVSLIFTCLEMDNYKKDEYPEYSAPKELAWKLAEIANRKKVRLHGENALPMQGNQHNYYNIAENLLKYNFTCFTFLRINYLVDERGNPTKEMNHFRNLINYISEINGA